jgi:membrane-associated phospholipid phosphatase
MLTIKPQDTTVDAVTLDPVTLDPAAIETALETALDNVRDTVLETVMETTATLERLPRTSLGERIATWISHAASPPVLGILSALLLSVGGVTWAWEWSVNFVALVILVPAVYVAWLFVRGEITDLHVPMREQRTRPYLVALAAAFAAWALFTWWPAPPLHRVIALAALLQAALFLLITLRWKVSMHSAAAANLAAVGWMVFGAVGLLLAVGVPAIAWARVRLHRHTLAQTVAGALLGGATTLAAYWVI